MVAENQPTRVTILDSTLRDGAQGEGISFSIQDKISIVRALDTLGIDFIEAGNPGSNPKDLEFFHEASRLILGKAKLAAFGSTRRVGVSASDDEGLRSLLGVGTETVVLFGKSWDFHVKTVLKASQSENLAMITESCAFAAADGRRVIYDAEHFFDGYAANPEYAMRSLAAAVEGGASCIVLCDTNGGSGRRRANFRRAWSSVYMRTTTVDSVWPIPWRPSAPGLAISRDASLASASVAATPTSLRSSLT